MSDKPASRRDFLTRAAGLAAATGAAASTAGAASSRVIGANDRIRAGIIGVGGKARGHIRMLTARKEAQNDVEIVAVSDIYKKRLEERGQMAGVEPKDRYHDYHDLLAREDIDAVWIVTPDHWHAPMTLDALAAGKDVYLEKPMTYTIAEARRIAERVRDSGRIVQVGSQHTSDVRYHKAKEVIGKGWIGQPVWAQNSYSRNSIHGEWNYHIDDEGTEKNIDWEAFLGPAPRRPFSQDRYFRWRKYWDYSGGIATDLFYHRLAPILMAVGPRFPVRVSGNGGIYVHKDREVPDTYATTIEYENFTMVMSASMACAAGNEGMPPMIYGHEGSIAFVDGGIVVKPEKPFLKKFQEATGQTEEVFLETPQENMSAGHIGNFLTSMRSRKQPVFDPEFGYQVMTAIRLGVDSYRNNRLMAFDPRRERVVEYAPGRPAYEGTGKNYEVK